jgi:gliding motility-associated-like protein
LKRRLLFTLLSILFLKTAAFSQNSGCFKAFYKGVEVTEICQGESVEFRDFSCGSTGATNAEQYDLDASDGKFNNLIPNSPGKLFTFPNAGTFTVTQVYTPTCDPLTSNTPNTFVVKPIVAPTFTATQCGHDSVNVIITDTNYPQYNLEIGSTVYTNVARNFKYPSPANSYVVKVTGIYTQAGCGGSATSPTLTPLAAQAQPKISKLDVLQTSNSGQIELTISGLINGYSYVIEQQNGARTNLNFSNSATTVTLSGLNTTVENCFRVLIYDNCGSNQGIASPLICSVPLQAIAQNKKNVLTWPAYKGSTPNGGSISYQILRQQGANSQTINVPAGTTTFEDTDIFCGLEYCYELAVLEGSNAFSLSNSACIKAVSTDTPPAAFLLTSFEPTNVLRGTLTLPAQASIKEQQVFKSRNGAGFQQVLKSTSLDFLDSDKNLGFPPICYKIIYSDNCGNISPESNESCPVILKAEHNNKSRTVQLEWTPYQGFKGTSLTYTLELLDENFQPKTSEPVTGSFSLTKTNLSNTDQLLRYRIKVQSEISGETSYSNTETVVQEVKIFIPSAFSPNNDGLNDVFEVKGRFQNNFSLVILNRWGQVIFESRDPKQGWDGKMNGSEVPMGVYAYRLSAIDEQGLRYEKSGTVTLLR